MSPADGEMPRRVNSQADEFSRAVPNGSPGPQPGGPSEAVEVSRRLRSLSRRGFALAGLAATAGLGGWSWLVTRSDDDDIPWPLRRVLKLNENLARAAFRSSRLAGEFPPNAARVPRVNGTIGLDAAIDIAAWRLRVIGHDDTERRFRLDEIRALPRVEMTTELRCIEGWSTVVHWAGARLLDLATITGLAARNGRPGDPRPSAGELLRYVAAETPNAAYYVGVDMASALHPQTLLCYEMQGRPLTPGHGAPLRLVIPVKYGIKQIKQLGAIRFTDRRPADYWAERGYDWYAGH